MIIKRVRPAGRVRRSGDLFVGEHEYQNAVGTESAQFRMSELTFRDGAHTKMHVHDSEQIVLVIAGEGIIATAAEEQRIGTGDVEIAERHIGEVVRRRGIGEHHFGHQLRTAIGRDRR